MNEANINSQDQNYAKPIIIPDLFFEMGVDDTNYDKDSNQSKYYIKYIEHAGDLVLHFKSR